MPRQGTEASGKVSRTHLPTDPDINQQVRQALLSMIPFHVDSVPLYARTTNNDQRRRVRTAQAMNRAPVSAPASALPDPTKAALIVGPSGQQQATNIPGPIVSWPAQRATSGFAVGSVTAVDVNGNLLLKNVTNAPGTTSGPTTTSNILADLPEMTRTITTKGNSVFITFVCTGSTNTAGTGLFFNLLRDGTVIGPQAHDVSAGANQLFTAVITWVDITPSAASHTYKIQWALDIAGGGRIGTASATDRSIEVVELG